MNHSSARCGLCGEVEHAAILCPSFHRADIVRNPSTRDRFLARLRALVIGATVGPILDASRAALVDMHHVLTPEVRLEPTPGHTPGHVSVRISSRGEEAVITGDLMHHPLQCAEPDLANNFDVDAAAARPTEGIAS